MARILLVTAFSWRLRVLLLMHTTNGDTLVSEGSNKEAHYFLSVKCPLLFADNTCSVFRYEGLSTSLQSSLFIFHFLGLFWMCPVCQRRRVAFSGPPPQLGFGMILLCASHNSGLKKKAKLFLNFEIISDFEKSWENVVQSIPAYSSYRLPKY